MLEHTVHRAEKLILAERIFTVINEAHLAFPDVQQHPKRSSCSRKTRKPPPDCSFP
jgi:hypothetical protein